MPSIIPIRCMALLLALGNFPADAAPLPQPEDELKAAVVLSFLRYTEWPATQPANRAIVVGVLGRPSFTQVLRHALEGKPVNDRAIRVVEVKTAADAQSCQVLYFAADRSSDLQQTLLGLRLARVLTIGESKGFLESGGAVNLLLLDGHMSFEVSVDALERAGVNISSKLLRFGQIRSRSKGDRSS